MVEGTASLPVSAPVAKAALETGTPIEPGTQTVEASVTVEFEVV
jgi:uncharacterized protein YggE